MLWDEQLPKRNKSMYYKTCFRRGLQENDLGLESVLPSKPRYPSRCYCSAPQVSEVTRSNATPTRSDAVPGLHMLFHKSKPCPRLEVPDEPRRGARLTNGEQPVQKELSPLDTKWSTKPPQTLQLWYTERIEMYILHIQILHVQIFIPLVPSAIANGCINAIILAEVLCCSRARSSTRRKCLPKETGDISDAGLSSVPWHSKKITWHALLPHLKRSLSPRKSARFGTTAIPSLSFKNHLFLNVILYRGAVARLGHKPANASNNDISPRQLHGFIPALKTKQDLSWN